MWRHLSRLRSHRCGLRGTFGCGGTETACHFTRAGLDYGTTAPTDLAALKEQLKQQIAAIEKQQAAEEENLRPQTVEDVDMLTAKLNEALEELKARRTELARKSELTDESS